MAGMAWQTTHVAKDIIMPVPINAIKNIPTTSGWTNTKRPNL